MTFGPDEFLTTPGQDVYTIGSFTGSVSILGMELALPLTIATEFSCTWQANAARQYFDPELGEDGGYVDWNVRLSLAASGGCSLVWNVTATGFSSGSPINLGASTLQWLEGTAVAWCLTGPVLHPIQVRSGVTTNVATIEV